MSALPRNSAHAIFPGRNERIRPARREYEAVPLDTVAGARKGTKGRFGRREEGARLCKQRSQFSRRTLRAASAPPRDPSPSRTSSFFYLLLLFASSLSLYYLFLSLTLSRGASHGTRLPTSLSWPAITQAPLAKLNVCYGGLRHCESVLEEPYVQAWRKNAQRRVQPPLRKVFSCDDASSRRDSIPGIARE